MGFGDAFIAATVGCLLAFDPPVQLRAAALAAVLGVAFDLLFFAVDTLPATVPIALALALATRWPSVRGSDQGDRVDRCEAGEGEADPQPR
jgi:hypothetical protein